MHRLFLRILCRIVRIWDHAVRYVVGRDIFVSYSRKDERYAPALVLAVSALRPRTSFYPKNPKISFYLDRWIAPAGADPPPSLKRNLLWSGLMVVVCTKSAMQSKFVRDELRSFGVLGKKIIPINVDGAFYLLRDDPKLWKLIGGAAPETESQEAIDDGKPSDKVLNRIVKSIDFTTQQRRLERAVWSTLALVVILTGGSFLYDWWVVRQANADVATAKSETHRQQGLAEAEQEKAPPRCLGWVAGSVMI